MRKNTVVYPVITNQSMSASFNSSPTIIRYLDNVSYQINVTTTDSTGTFNIQVSNDYQFDEVANRVVSIGNWDNLTLSGTPSAAGANDIINISLNQLPFYAIRLSYTAATAGTGTCSAYLSAKQVGG